MSFSVLALLVIFAIVVIFELAREEPEKDTFCFLVNITTVILVYAAFAYLFGGFAFLTWRWMWLAVLVVAYFCAMRFPIWRKRKRNLPNDR